MSHAVLGTFIHKNDSLSEIQLERARARCVFLANPAGEDRLGGKERGGA